MKVWRSEYSGTCVTNPFKLSFLLSLSPLPSNALCFYYFFLCRFFFISVILCSIESSLSCSFLYSLLSIKGLFLGLPNFPSAETFSSSPLPYLIGDRAFTSLRRYRCEKDGASCFSSPYLADSLFCSC